MVSHQPPEDAQGAANDAAAGTVHAIAQGRPWPRPEDGGLTAAQKLHDRGCLPVPLASRHKNPPRGWQQKRFTREQLGAPDAKGKIAFTDDEPQNVGIALGRLSGGLAAINLAADEHVEALAPRLLPDTVTISRESRQHGVRLYSAPGIKTQQFRDPLTSELLCEVLADDSHGRPAHLVVHGLHEETGERIRFDGEDEPQILTAGALYTQAARLAAAALLRSRARQLEAYELAGALTRAGWTVAQIAMLLSPVFGEDHRHTAELARERHADGKPLSTWNAVEKRLGEGGVRLIAVVTGWLGAQLKVGRGDFACRLVSELLEDAPVDNLRVPERYSLGPAETSTIETGADGDPDSETVRRLTGAPVLVTGVLEGSDGAHLHLSWRTHSGWRSTTCDRRTALDGNKLVGLAQQRFPVGGDNAKDMAKYLRLFEEANAAQLPAARLTNQVGWQPDGSFLWGHTRLTGDERVDVSSAATNPVEWTADTIVFRGDDAGDEQMMGAYRSAGTLAGWLQAMRPLAGYPLAQAGFYAAFVPPLMQVCGIPSFVVDYALQSSSGKTTCMRIAASVWGQPDERLQPAVIKPWNNTRVAIERTCAALNGLPLFLDDTQTARKVEDVQAAVYDIVAGQTRGRGTGPGLGKVRSFRTVLISSGETPIKSLAKAGGVHTRTLEIDEPPWGAADASTRPIVDAMRSAVDRHHGHAGPAFVEHLLRCRETWPDWRLEYLGLRDQYQAAARTGEHGRLAEYVAAIDLAASIVHRMFDLPWNPAACLEALDKTAGEQAQTAAIDKRALSYLWGAIAANEQKFYGRHRVTAAIGEPVEPGGGWWGFWEAVSDWKHVDVYEAVVERVLGEGGFPIGSLLGAWKRQGVTQTQADRRTLKRRNEAGVNVDVVRLLRSGQN